MGWKQPNWTRILTILLVILTSCALLYVAVMVLSRFTQAILLFVMGAIVAYVLTPLVNRLERAFRYRWLGIVLSYVMVAVAIFILGIVLVTPFVQQAQSLVDNLHTPERGSLKTITQVQTDTNLLRQHLQSLQQINLAGLAPAADLQSAADSVSADLTRLRTTDLADLSKGTLSATSHSPQACRPRAPGKVTPCPKPQTQVPPSYVDKVSRQITVLNDDWTRAAPRDGTVNESALNGLIRDTRTAQSVVDDVKKLISGAPILLLRSQDWLDQHNIHLDILSKIGVAGQQVSDQGSNILNNAITIVSATLAIFLNFTLILIIAFYLLLDGRKLIRQGLDLVPTEYHDPASFFIQSVDKVMGGYIRGQIVLSLLAGLLGGGGAAVLGVPYPLLIGLATALLDAVPVIGPLVAFVPAVIISLFFMPIVTTVILTIWFMVFQQIVTNILGPRIIGAAVGIHPLEALLAVMVGYPLAGFLGSFLAVPMMGILHILIREAYAYFILRRTMPEEPAPAERHPRRIVPLPRRTGSRAKRDTAAQ